MTAALAAGTALTFIVLEMVKVAALVATRAMLLAA